MFEVWIFKVSRGKNHTTHIFSTATWAFKYFDSELKKKRRVGLILYDLMKKSVFYNFLLKQNKKRPQSNIMNWKLNFEWEELIMSLTPHVLYFIFSSLLLAYCILYAKVTRYEVIAIYLFKLTNHHYKFEKFTLSSLNDSSVWWHIPARMIFDFCIWKSFIAN